MRIAVLVLVLGCGKPTPEPAEGSAGIDGAEGEQGLAGPQGDRGLEGPQGVAGPQGEQGPQGIQGEEGDPGIDGLPGVPGVAASIGWADAVGLRVLDWPELIYIDADGSEWDVNPVTATASAKFGSYRGVGAQIYYDEYGCLGEEWVPELIEISTPGIYDGWTFTPILPRQPFLVYNGGSDWHVLDDDAVRQWVAVRSTDVLGVCSGVIEWGTYAYRYSEITSDPNTAVPALSWVPPLHRVR